MQLHHIIMGGIIYCYIESCSILLNDCICNSYSGTADLYYDATTKTLGSVSLLQSLYFTMQLGCIFIHPKVYEISRVHGLCTSSCFSFEVWLHHSTKYDNHGCSYYAKILLFKYMVLISNSNPYLFLCPCYLHILISIASSMICIL